MRRLRLGPHFGRNLVIVVALMAAGFFGAYLRFLPYLSHEANYTDGRSTYELSEIDQLRFAVWDEPTPLPPLINTTDREGRAALSPDGNILVFAVGEPGLNVDLWVADMVDGEPVDPHPLFRLNSIGDDMAPAFERDGLLFASNRSGSRGFDIWRAPYEDGVFGPPERLTGGINTEANETDPAPVPGSGAIVFSSNRKQGMREDHDLYWAVPAEGDDWTVTNFAEVNTPFDEREAAFTRGGLGLIFSSNRAGGAGGFDLLHTVQNVGEWQKPVFLEGINSPDDERAPLLSADGFTLMFTLAAPHDAGDLYQARSVELFRLPGRRVGWMDLTLLAVILLIALLAWLGRRWDALDILYKALLISLLLHLALMWWFTEVAVEQKTYDVNEGSRSFQVRLAPSNIALAKSREMAGQLEVTSARGDELSTPDRSQLMAAPLELPQAAPGAETSMEMPEVADGRDDSALQAERTEVSVQELARAAQPEAVAVSQPSTQVDLRTGEAPAVGLAARAIEAAPTSVSQPQLLAAAATDIARPAMAATAVSEPEAGELPRPATGGDAAPAAVRQADAAPLARQQASDEGSVALAMPAAEVNPITGEAPTLGIEAAEIGLAPATPSTAQRVERVAGAEFSRPAAVPSAVAGPAEMTLPTPVAAVGAGPAVAREDSGASKPQRPDLAAAVAVAAPEARAEVKTGGAPLLSLDASDVLAAPAVSTARPLTRSAPVLARPSFEGAPVSMTTSTELPSPTGLAATARPDLAERVPAGEPPVRATRPDRAVAVAEPSVVLPTSGGSGDPDASSEAAPELDLSSLGSVSQAGVTTREVATPERRAPRAELEIADVTPSSRNLTAQREGPPSAPPPRRRGDGGPVAPASRGVPWVALHEEKEETGAPGLLSQPSHTWGGQADVVEAIGHFRLDATSTGVTPAQEMGGAPERADVDWNASATPLALADVTPDFRPLEAVVAVTDDIPAIPEPSRDEWEHTPYRSRFGEAKVKALEEHGGNEETEAAVRAGLAYLASTQHRDGYWGDASDFHDKYGRVTVGKTALAMLAFLGAGHTPDSQSEFSDTTSRAVEVLLASQDPETGHFGYTNAYSHAISTYALAECFALTGDSRLRRPLERAVSWIIRHQHRQGDRRLKGGWGYYYPDGRVYDRWPRTSVTVWQVMALESARLGGLQVPDKVFTEARAFLLYAHQPDEGVVLYNHDPTRLAANYWTLPGSTPAGMFALSLLGEELNARPYEDTIDWVLDRAPNGYRKGDADEFVHEATGNLYFWYYGSLMMFRHGGGAWEQWNRKLQDTLLPAQNSDGSWMPISMYAEYAGDTEEDRSYTTAMCVLTLEVYYRYFTPLLTVR